MSERKLGDIVVGEGVHPFYVDMDAQALFEAIVGWTVIGSGIDEDAPPDALTIALSREGHVFELALNYSDLTERNTLTVDLVSYRWPTTMKEQLPTAYELAGNIGIEIELDPLLANSMTEEDEYKIYQQAGRTDLIIFEDQGHVEEVTIG